MSAPSVLHHDQAYLILNKPAGLPTTAPRTPSAATDTKRADPQHPNPNEANTETLVAWAREYDPSAALMHPTSRLDSDVTGIVTFALTKKANQQLLNARTAGAYRRTYISIAAGALPKNKGTWDIPIGLHPRTSKLRQAGGVPGQRGAREARTHFSSLASFPAIHDRQEIEVHLLHLQPQTGRTHQLRVHASHAGVPMVGDRRYQGLARVTAPNGAVVMAPRVMLHCLEVALPLPGNHNPNELEIRAPIPEDFREVWSGLAGHANAKSVDELVAEIDLGSTNDGG